MRALGGITLESGWRHGVAPAGAGSSAPLGHPIPIRCACWSALPSVLIDGANMISARWKSWMFSYPHVAIDVLDHLRCGGAHAHDVVDPQLFFSRDAEIRQ